eukprot:Tamp_34758.p1 GENE.Tamp_34758~~Tamp_34758.p1  ORF type:complete len:150 (+),score=7.38 Tamp_34758:3-452(+)
MRFVCGTFPLVGEVWYPSAQRVRCLVDEYLDWHIAKIRTPCAQILASSVALRVPCSRGLAQLQAAAARLMDAVQEIENCWLADGRQYLCGAHPTIADLAAICDLETVEFLKPDHSTCPAFVAWRLRLRSRDSYKVAHEHLWPLVRSMGL